MAPGPALGARHPPDPVETNIDPVSLFGGWPTLRVTCGTRRARALPQTFRGDVGRSRDSKARARPARQVHPLVGQHLPAGQKSKIVKRGTAHRFSTSRYARMVAWGSPVMVGLRRPRRAGEKVVRPFPMWRVRPSWHPAPPWARGIRRTLWRPTSILYPYSVAGQRPRSAAGRVARPLLATVRGDVGRSRDSKGRAARTVCCIA